MCCVACVDPVVREKDLEVKVKFLVQTTLPMPAPVAGAGGQRSSVAYTQTAAPVVIKQVIETMPISVHMSSTKDDKVSHCLLYTICR